MKDVISSITSHVCTHPLHLRSKAVLTEPPSRRPNINVGNVIRSCNRCQDWSAQPANGGTRLCPDNLPFQEQRVHGPGWDTKIHASLLTLCEPQPASQPGPMGTLPQPIPIPDARSALNMAASLSISTRYHRQRLPDFPQWRPENTLTYNN